MDGQSLFHKLFVMAEQAFPIKGNDSHYQEILFKKLRRHWLHKIKKYSEDAYGLSWQQFMVFAYYGPSNEDADFDLRKFPQFLARYAEEFAEEIPFATIKLIYPKDRRKHWLIKEATEKQTDTLSIKSDSLFYWSMVPQLVEEWMWLCMGVFYNNFLAGEPRYYYLRANRPIGASDGKPVYYVCLEIDFTAKQAHAYPIPESGVGDKAYLINLEDYGIVIKSPD